MDQQHFAGIIKRDYPGAAGFGCHHVNNAVFVSRNVDVPG
jgi:hypothetical protein